jgi:AcrR family transcriptional regulator
VTPVTRRTQAERSAATRAALLGAARTLFAEKGFAATGREEIVEAAGVTRGALHHHYGAKMQLFRAVYEELEHEIMTQVAAAAARGARPKEQLRLGSLAYLDAAMDPAVQRVCLIDGTSVLGWEVRAEISGNLALGMVQDVLRAAMDAGEIDPQPVDVLAHVLLAALHEAVLLVARADDQAAARAEVGVIVERVLDRL